MTHTNTASNIRNNRRPGRRQSRTMNHPTKITAITVAILAAALSAFAINCQNNPDPTPTTAPSPAPTATESYIPPTLTPTRTPVPEPTPTPSPTQTPVPQPTATPSPTAEATPAPEAIEINASLEFDLIAKLSPQDQQANDTDKLYELFIHVISEVNLITDTDLQLICASPSEPQRKCANDWEIGHETSTEHHITLKLPAGEHHIAVQHNGTAIAQALLLLNPGAAGDATSAWVDLLYNSEPGDPPEVINEFLALWSESPEDSEQVETQHHEMPEQVNEILARIEDVGHSASLSVPRTGEVAVKRLFNVSLRVSYELNLEPDDRPSRLQILCANRSEPRWKCADDLDIANETDAERQVTVKLPAGYHQITIHDGEAPIATTLVSVNPSDSPPHNEAEVTVHHDTWALDVSAFGQVLLPGSNGIVPRVNGYWSDGSADIEIFAGSQSVKPNDTLICQFNQESSQPCNSETSLTTDGRYTRITMRLPFGTTHLDIFRNDTPVLSSNIIVAHRTVGVHPDVLDCFTDTTFYDANAKPDDAYGCAGWNSLNIVKWPPNQPLRIKLIGPQEWTTFFKNELELSQHLFGINFEWVTDDQEADLEAVVGFTREEAIEQESDCGDPYVAGCATLGVTVDNNEYTPRIIVYNLQLNDEDQDALPTESGLNQLRTTILHEAVHAFTGMGHRIEVGTLMQSFANEFGGRQLTLSPMDLALVQLHAHPDIRHGMSVHDIRHLFIPDDKLLDYDAMTQEPTPGFNAWNSVYSAFQTIRNAASATYNITTSMPGCNQAISGATYQVAKLAPGWDTFQWASIQSQQANIYHLAHPDFDAETWSDAATGWATSDVRPEDVGWGPIKTDPYTVLVHLLLVADWDDVEVTKDDGETITITTDIPWTASNENLGIQLTINQRTSTITDYNLNWSRGIDTCSGYIVTATNGAYGTTFNIPIEIRTNSEVVSACNIPELPPNPRTHRVSSNWHHECPTELPDAAYAETRRFTTDTWSLLRLDFQSPTEAFLVLTDTTSGDSLTIEPSTDIRLLIGLEGHGRFIEDIDPWQFGLPLRGSYAWHHQWLPPGTYEIQAATRERSYPGRFTLIVDAQPIPGPPESLRFKAVATSIDRTCALLTDGTPLCWGRPRDTSQQPTIPQGKFENIYGGDHYCATTADGSAQCWDFKEAGQHECAPDENSPGSLACREATADDTTNGGFLSGFYFDLTPPDGEALMGISPGRYNACGLRNDNTVACWGSNNGGESDPPTDATFTKVTTSIGYACGLTSSGRIQCWGDDGRGPFNLPTDATFTDFGISFSYGSERTCTLNAQGQVQCFSRIEFQCIPSASSQGSVQCSEIQDDWTDPGDPDYVPTPLTLNNPAPGQTFIALSTEAPECGIKPDGTAQCWHIWPNVGSPPPTETFTQISAGKHHACGLRTDNTIACWGENHYGQATPPNGTFIPNTPQ